jgi:hypothetical protein
LDETAANAKPKHRTSRSIQEMQVLLRQRSTLERVIAGAIFLLLFFALTGVKMARHDQQFGDTAIFFQLTENLAQSGKPTSPVFEQFRASQAQSLQTEKAPYFLTAPLSPPTVFEENMFRWHTWYILAPLALFAKVMPVDAVLFGSFALSFLGLVFSAYLILREKGIPVFGALIFCILIISHPAWSEGLQWQFYPDRLFVLSGFLLMYFFSESKRQRLLLVALTALCASIVERAPIVIGIFMLLNIALYWRQQRQDRMFKIVLGLSSLVVGILFVKVAINNFEYSSFLPANIGQIASNFQLPGFAQNVGLFLLVNAVFLALALFEWRAAAIAFVLMIPNIIGNIGGAEKTGWATHYHDFYLPALIWASLVGYIAAYRFVSRKRMSIAVFYGVGLLLALFLSSIDPHAAINLKLSNVANNFLATFPAEAESYLGANGRKSAKPFEDVQKAIPEGSIVSAPQGGLPLLYRNRIVNVFPIDIDRADYAVMTFTRVNSHEVTYGGMFSYLGPKVTDEINEALVERMKKDGYDFTHAILVPEISAAVIRRSHQ